MVEAVGEERIDEYAARLAGLLSPGGRLLSHGIAKLKDFDTPDEGAFSERFVFPDGVSLPLSRIQLALERSGLVTTHVEEFQADYAETLRHWIERYEQRYDDAMRHVGRRAREDLAALPQGGAARFRDRLGLALPSARAPAIGQGSQAAARPASCSATGVSPGSGERVQMTAFSGPSCHRSTAPGYRKARTPETAIVGPVLLRANSIVSSALSHRAKRSSAASFPDACW